jgi:hypothetical protein
MIPQITNLPSRTQSQANFDASVEGLFSQLNALVAAINALPMVSITGALNGIPIGEITPAFGAFSSLSVTNAPTNAIDVANKNYVDTSIANLLQSGNRVTFLNSVAPVGWTKDLTVANDSALRIVTGNVGSGGTYDFSAGCTVVAAHTHSFTSGNESADHIHSGNTGGRNAAHTHDFASYISVGGGSLASSGIAANSTVNTTTQESADHGHAFNTGGRSAAHTHSGVTGDSDNSGTWIPKYIDAIVCTKN